MSYCEYCGKKIKAFTVSRDWQERRLHKTCIIKKNNALTRLDDFKKYCPNLEIPNSLVNDCKNQYDKNTGNKKL